MSLKEINLLYKKFDKVHTNVNQDLDLLESGQSADAQLAVQNDISPKVKELHQFLEALKFAYTDLNDVDKQANKKKFKEYKQYYVAVLNRTKDASNRAQRNELLGTGNGEAVDDEDSTEDRYIAEGEMILDKNQEILQQTLMRVHDARQLGEGGVDMLRKQNEQLVKISDDLDQMETSLDVSKKLLRQMGLKLATDKYIWILLLLVCLGIVAVFIIIRLWREE